MFWFIVLLLIAGAVFYFYQKLMAIEREIRAEQAVDQDPVAEVDRPKTAAVESSDSSIVTPEVDKMTSKVTPVAPSSLSLEDEILVAVNNLPGVKQSALYNSFADINKKQLQQIVKVLADGGKLRREKAGNSYLLFPA